MFVDPEALADLEFFRVRGICGRSVFQYIDYCRTEGGRDYIKNLVKNSPRNAAQITELQTITKFFYDFHDRIQFDITPKMVWDFEEYVNSNYIGVDLVQSFNPFLHGAFYRYYYPDLFGLKKIWNFSVLDTKKGQ